MGVASGRQGQSYGIVTIALKKGFTDSRTGIRYDEHFLTSTQMKVNFKDLYSYARSHPGLTFVVAYTKHCAQQPRARSGPQRVQLQLYYNVLFEDHFDRVVYGHSMQPAQGHLLYGLHRQA